MVAADAFGHVALHVHAVAKLLVGSRLLEAAARTLIVEHLVHELVEGHLIGIISVLGQVSLRAAHSNSGIDPELLGHFLDQAHGGIEQFLARRLVRTLQQPVGDEPVLLACDLAGLIHELHRHSTGIHQCKRCDLLRRVRQNGVMALDVVAGGAVFAAPNLMHEGRLALKQQQAKVMLAARVVRRSLGSCGSCRDLLLGGVVGQRRHGGRLFLIFEIHHQQIAGRRVFHTPKLLGHELGHLHGKVHEATLALEIRAQLRRKPAVREELTAAVIHTSQRMPDNAHDVRFDVLVRQIQLVFGKHVHARDEIEHVQHRVVDLEHPASPLPTSNLHFKTPWGRPTLRTQRRRSALRTLTF